MIKKKIFIISNSYWNLYNFRYDLISKLLEKYEITLIANKDNFFYSLESFNCNKLTVKFHANKIKLISDIIFFLNLFSILKKNKPDLIICYTIKPVIYASLIKYFLNFKIINVITGFGTLYLKNKLLRNLFKFLLFISQKKVNKIIFQNNEDKDYFINSNIAKIDQSFTIPGSGVNSEFFKSKYYPENDNTIFLFVGRLIKEKGIIELCNVFENLNRNLKYKVIILGIVNKKNPSDISKKVFDKANNNKHITILTNVKNVKKYYEKSNCLILPSYREGLSKSCLEAMSMSRPILVNNVPGCKNLVFNSQNGYVFDLKDKSEFSRIIEKFIKLEHKKKIEMGNKSREFIEKYYSSKIIVKMYEEIINSVNESK